MQQIEEEFNGFDFQLGGLVCHASDIYETNPLLIVGRNLWQTVDQDGNLVYERIYRVRGMHVPLGDYTEMELKSMKEKIK